MAKSRTDEAVERLNAGQEPGTREGDGDDTDTRDVVVEPEPEPVVLTPAETWLAEAYEVQAVVGKGEAYSPDAVKRLMLSAIPVVEALKESQSKPEARKR